MVYHLDLRDPNAFFVAGEYGMVLSRKTRMTALAEIVTSTERGQFLVPNAALRYKPADAGRKRGPMMDRRTRRSISCP